MRRVLIILFILLFIPFKANALDFNSEAADGDKIYICGNPDLYPLEYYDMASGEYKGVLTDIYREIEEKTGLEFAYISKGADNRQEQMARNSQADIISVHGKNLAVYGVSEYYLINYNGTNVYIGFTKIMDEDTVKLIRTCLDEYDDEKLLRLVLESDSLNNPKENRPIYSFGVIAILGLLLVFMIYKNHKYRKKEKELNRSKYLDPLTGSGNYLYLEENYEAMVHSENYSLFYLAYIGIDSHFIEKYAGIDSLNEIQKNAAVTLESSAEKDDVLSRVRDGVFALLFQSASDMSAREYISELLRKINTASELIKTYETGFSAGVYRLEKAGMSFDEVYSNAQYGYDMAVSENREFYFVSHDVLLKKERTTKLERRLKQAIDNDEFDIFLQYIVDDKGEIAGGEILSRWYNQEFGLTKPNMYIEALIDSGLIDEFDFYIFDKVCALLEKYKDTDKKNLWFSCNFTRQTFSRKDFEERMKKVVDRHDFNHSSLVVELTEDCLISDHEQAYVNVVSCKRNGFKIALDDLGSGYSSISDLCDYPIDLIKIDRYIVVKAVEERGFAFLKGFIELAHSLGIMVLCEGVESQLQDEMVLRASADYIQGYFYARVLPIDEADSFFLKYNSSITNQGVDNGKENGNYQELP